MENLKFLKKKRRKKVAAIVSAVSAGVLSVLILVAFIGRAIGTFTIQLDNEKNGIKLSLSESSSFDKMTTHLWLNKVPSCTTFTESGFQNYEDLDSEETDYLYGAKLNKRGDVKALYFFKCTFFVKNVGNKPASFDFELDITENNKPKNVSYALDDILRVRVYKNSLDNDTHEYVTYAKASRTDVHMDEDGNPSNQEKISEDNPTYAEEFLSEKQICKETTDQIIPEEITRYTVVAWLEGSDPQANGTAPDDCSLKLGAKISAYEIEE